MKTGLPPRGDGSEATLAIVARCRMRALRGKTSLRAFEQQTGIDRGDLSKIERGRLLPLPKHVPALEAAYGPRAEWWTADVRIEEVAA